jgi:hypothetical protein
LNKKLYDLIFNKQNKQPAITPIVVTIIKRSKEKINENVKNMIKIIPTKSKNRSMKINGRDLATG